MALALRLTPAGEPTEDPEDFFGDSLGVVFEDDTLCLHGDADHALLYKSPHLPKPLHISLADPDGDADRQLFSHYLWNASLLLAEFVEAGTLTSQLKKNGSITTNTNTQQTPSLASPLGPPLTDFDVTGLATIELGAGTALPSLLASLLGARRAVMTDYPARAVISNLRANAVRNLQAGLSPLSRVSAWEVEGHAWGELDDDDGGGGGNSTLAGGNRHAFDRVLVCDCLWMGWQHENLLRSIAWFLREGREARCWCVAGFHSGRAAMRGFFAEGRLRAVGLEVERIWERDCEGGERAWAWDRGIEDPGERKRWLTFAVLRRRGFGEGEAVIVGGGGGGDDDDDDDGGGNGEE